MARPSAPENLILISLTIGAAGLAALCVYRMLAPLVAPQADLDRQPLSERMRLDLEREKALTLRSIKELEFDRAMGKVSPQDFDDMAGRLRARALGIMKQLDAGATVYRDADREGAGGASGEQGRVAAARRPPGAGCRPGCAPAARATIRRALLQELRRETGGRMRPPAMRVAGARPGDRCVAPCRIAAQAPLPAQGGADARPESDVRHAAAGARPARRHRDGARHPRRADESAAGSDRRADRCEARRRRRRPTRPAARRSAGWRPARA